MLNAFPTSQRTDATRRGCPLTGKPETINKATAICGISGDCRLLTKAAPFTLKPFQNPFSLQSCAFKSNK